MRELYYYILFALDKIYEIYTFDLIAVHMSGLAKNNFWLVGTQKKKKKRIEEQLDYIWNMCPKLFSWGKK